MGVSLLGDGRSLGCGAGPAMFVLPSLHPSRRRHRPGWAVWQAGAVRRLAAARPCCPDPADSARGRPRWHRRCSRAARGAAARPTPAGSVEPRRRGDARRGEEGAGRDAGACTSRSPRRARRGRGRGARRGEGDVVRPDRFSGSLDVARRRAEAARQGRLGGRHRLGPAVRCRVGQGRPRAVRRARPGHAAGPAGRPGRPARPPRPAPRSPARSGAARRCCGRSRRADPRRGRREGAHHDRRRASPCPRSSASTRPPASSARPR